MRIKADELNQERWASVVSMPTPASGMPTLTDYLEQQYLPWHAAEFPASSANIARMLRLHVLPTFGALALDRIAKGKVEAWKQERLRTAKPATVTKELRALSAALNHAVLAGVLSANPVRGVKAPKDIESDAVRFLSAEELQRLYAHSQPLAGDEAAKGLDPNGWQDWAPVWKLMANTGLRRAEALQLRWSHVSDTQLRVVSTSGARTKSGKWRLVPLSAGAQEALAALKTMTGKTPFVLPRVHARSLTRAFERCAARAGLTGHLHLLRHTFCASLVSGGVPLRTVQVLAGHAHFSTTEKYAHLAPDYLASAVAQLRL